MKHIGRKVKLSQGKEEEQGNSKWGRKNTVYRRV